MNIPQRIVLILPCCIGDVVLATATLSALRRAYPHAHITWAIGAWSKLAIEHHPDLNATLDTGHQALPVKSWAGFWRFVRQLREGHFDLAISLVRSPLMSLAVMLSGIPHTAGLDSHGRGFGYRIKSRINPQQPHHESLIYLSVLDAMGIPTHDVLPNIPIASGDHETVLYRLHEANIQAPWLVVNPSGGQNPGMVMDIKRYPMDWMADLTERLLAHYGASLVVVAGPKDQALVDTFTQHLTVPYQAFVGKLAFGEIGALANMATLYVGNDTGLTHLASASGANTVMILGPSDPTRYAPRSPNSLAVWKPSAVQSGGVAHGLQDGWTWTKDGIRPEEAYNAIVAKFT